MSSSKNPGRAAGFLYLGIVLLGPLRLLYIPTRLFVTGNAPATVGNIAAHEWLFRFGVVSDLIAAIVLVYLTLALYRLFREVSAELAVQVVIFGGVMPALLYFVNLVSDLGTLSILRSGDFLSVFDPRQRDAIVLLLLKLHDQLNNGAELLWGVWLFPLAILTYRSRFLPRFLGVWLAIDGLAYVALSFTGVLWPESKGRLFALSQPALFGELAFMLWLVIKGARPLAAAPLP